MWIVKKPKPFNAGEQGFTLLEVLIAFAIFFVSFAVIAGVISGSMRDASRTKERNIVGMLAKRKMVELEESYETRTFDEFKKEEEGQFETPYEDYFWKYEIKELEFPNISQQAQAAAQSNAGSDPGDDSQNGGAAGEQVSRLVTKYLSKAVREVRLTVSWPSGKPGKPLEFTLSTLWVNLNSDFQLTE